MTLIEWMTYLGTTAAWGVVSSVLTQVIKKVWPDVQNGVAKVVSGIVAVLVGFAAQALIPYAEQLPAAIAMAIIWVVSLLWYELAKWLDWNPSE